MHSSPSPAGVSTGLIGWRAGVNTQTPNDTVYAHWMRPETGALTVDICLVVPATPFTANGGAFCLALPDSTATGGNKRGYGAADLQIHRDGATKVAAGRSTFQAGENNATNGATSVSIGSGNVNDAGGCSLLGTDLISSTGADYGSGIGRQGTLRGIIGQRVHSGGAVATQADCQYERLVQGLRSSAGPNKILVAGAGTANTSNILTCPDQSAMHFMCQVIGFQAGMANIYASTIHGAIYRNGATVAFVGTPTAIAPGPFILGAGAAGWTVTATLDAANFGFSIAFTSPGVFTQWTVITHSGLAT